jgi:hypothetical protein
MILISTLQCHLCSFVNHMIRILVESFLEQVLIRGAKLSSQEGLTRSPPCVLQT